MVVDGRVLVDAPPEANRFMGREGRDVLESGPFWGRLTERRGCPHAMLAMDGPPHRTQRKHYGDVLSRRLVDEHRAGCDALVRDGFGEGTARIAVRDETRLLVARMVHHCLTRGADPIEEATARSLLEVFRRHGRGAAAVQHRGDLAPSSAANAHHGAAPSSRL